MTVKMVSLGGGDISVITGDVNVVTPTDISATITGVYGEWKDADIALGGTTSTEVDLGASFHNLQVEIPKITSGDVSFKVSRTSGGDFYILGTGSAIIQCGVGSITTTVGLSGYQYIQVVTAGTQVVAITIKIRGSNV